MLAFADPDLFLKVTAALTVGTLAVLALTGGRARAPNVFLAAFLALIAGNQTVEIVQGFVLGQPDPAWHRVATVLASADPFFLYYFSCVWPRRTVRDRRVPLVLVGVTALVLVATAAVFPPWSVPHASGRLHVGARTAFTLVTYLLVARHFLREARSAGNDAPRYLYYAASIAAVPLAAQAAFTYDLAAAAVGLPQLPSAPARLLAFATVLAVVAVAVAAPARHAPRETRRVAVTGALAGVALALVLGAHLILVGIAPGLAAWVDGQLVWIGRAGAAFRWEAFSVLAAVSVVRHDALGASLRARRHASRVVAGVATLALGGALVFGTTRALGLDDGRPLTAEALVLLALVVLSQSYRSLVVRIAEHAYGVPRDADASARLSAYRRAAEQAAAEGRVLAEDADLARLRRELDLDAASAALVADLVQDALDNRPVTPGQRLAGRYRVERLLARGSTGRVLLAVDEGTGARVVLKEIARDDEGAHEDALAEARIASGLDHAHVTRLLDVVERGASVVLVTEYMEAGSLETLVATRGPLDAERVMRVLDDVLAGLAAAHAAGIVHRDVKPANVLLTGNGDALRAKLADFGIARVQSGATLNADGAADYAGTWAFMAPERRRGDRATPASDVYAVGLLARGISRGPLTPAVERVVSRALHEEPARRWRDAGSMRRALADARQRVNPGTGGAFDPPRSRPPS